MAYTRPAWPKIPLAPSAFPLLGRLRQWTPLKGVKAWGTGPWGRRKSPVARNTRPDPCRSNHCWPKCDPTTEAHTRPALPKITSAPSVFPLLRAPQAMNSTPPPEGCKSLGGRTPEAGGNLQCRGTPSQICAEATTAGRSVTQQLKRWSEETLSPSGAFKQDLYDHAKVPHPGQSHSVVIYMLTYIKHNSRSGGCEFDLPNRPFFLPWSHFTRQTYSCALWAAACVIYLATQSKIIFF